MANQYRWVLLAALSIIAFVINVDYTAVNLALIPMSSNLHSNLNTIQWVLSAYALSWAVLVIPAGSYADKCSKKKICLLGLGIFLVGSLLAGLANSAGLLIAARVIQGVAGAIYVPTLYALIFLNFAEQERGRAMGMVSLGVGLGMAMGPFIGGVLLSWLGWRSIFFVNIPIGLIALAIIYRGQDTEQMQAAKMQISKSSTFLLSVSTITILYLLGDWQNWSEYFSIYTALVFLAVIGLGIFAYLQKSLKNPLVPLSLFSNTAFVGCCVGIFLEQYGFSTIMVAAGFYLQKVMQFSSLKSSVIYLFLTTVFGVIAVKGGSWVDRVGLRLPTVIGASMLVVGSVLFTFLSALTPIWIICAVFVVVGAGMGLAFAGLNTGVIKTVSQEQVGIGSSVFLMLALLGNSLGVTLTSMIYEKGSMIKLMHLFGTLSIEQVKQITAYISNIGSANFDLSLFSSTMQKEIIDHTISALTYGINHTMFINFFVCLAAVLFCVKLLKVDSAEENTLPTNAVEEAS